MEVNDYDDLNSSNLASLGSDPTELILSQLPIRSIVRAGAVCKLWRSIVTHNSFASRVSSEKKPWFFLYGQSNVSFKNNQAFGFDPEANEWIYVPTNLFRQPFSQDESFVGSGGFFFSIASRLCYSPVLRSSWLETPPLKISRWNPLVGAFNGKFIVVGGVRFNGGLVDIEDRWAVEIYDPIMDLWALCPPLPTDFRSGNSSNWLSSALFNGKFYVFGIYSCFVSSFDLDDQVWSGVQKLQPPGIVFSFLVACLGQLVLAGLCNTHFRPSFNLWRVDERTMEFSEIATMPQELLHWLFDSDEGSDEDDKFASLRCVGLGNLVYVFNEEHHRMYPACVCEITKGGSKCVWRRVPDLPAPVNRFHKVISFCSTVPLASVLEGEAGITS